MGVGLAIDRPLHLRDRASWARWSPTWRLLAIGMPLTIASVSLLGWGLGIAPAAALLLGSALAPTDPVLAGDVQVGGPHVGPAEPKAEGHEEGDVEEGDGETTREVEGEAEGEAEREAGSAGPPQAAATGDGDRAGHEEKARDEQKADEKEAEAVDEDEAEAVDEEDEVRFALTSEAGLNDGLAFPFVGAALLIATGTATSVGSWVGWLAWDLVGKIVIAIVLGAGLGWLLGRIAFRSRKQTLRLAEQGEPLLAIAALVMAYGLVQVAHGYGFLGVFACGLTLRAAERGHEYHRSMHDVVQRLERLLTLFILLMLGMGLSNGLLGSLDWRGVLVALALVFLIRPVAGVVSLRLRPRPPELPGGLARKEALAAAFFGVRGVGSLYYLAYAAGHAHFPEERWLWSTVAFAIVISVVVHGVLATPVMSYLERRRSLA